MGHKVFSSAVNFSAVTPSDSTLVTCKALYVGVSGDVAIAQSSFSTPVVFKAVPVGYLLVELKNGRIMSTATTATDIVQLDW